MGDLHEPRFLYQKKRDPKIVAVIDFGTSCSGYAYKLKASPDFPPRYRNDWPVASDLDILYPKTLTKLLYLKEYPKPSYWGHEAVQQYSKHKSDNREDGVYFFENFKMLLHHIPEDLKYKNDGRAYFIDSDGHSPFYSFEDGKKFYVVTLIADLLRIFKEEILTTIRNEKDDDDIKKVYKNEKDIHWYLTVPAIWDEKSKSLMRKAAKQANLIDDQGDEERLSFVLEPEAAALYCQFLMNEKLKANNANLNDSNLNTFITTLDNGGGTVDITTHFVNSDNKLEEVVPGNGGPYGSIYVDQNFEAFLDETIYKSSNCSTLPNNETIEEIKSFIIQSSCNNITDYNQPFIPFRKAMKEFKEEFPFEYTKFISLHWEFFKCQYDNKSDDKSQLDFSPELFLFLKEHHGEIIGNLRQNQGFVDKGILFKEGMVERFFFDPVLKEIKAKLYKHFEKVEQKISDEYGQGSNYHHILFFAGGFSSSPILQDYIKEDPKFRDKIINIPPLKDAAAAILFGAVLSGTNPEAIRKRCARKTIGISCVKKFEDYRDVEEKRVEKEHLPGWKFDGCDYRFQTYVKAGEPIEVGSTKSFRFQVDPQKETAIIPFYETMKEEPRYVDQEGVTELGILPLEIQSKNISNEALKIEVTAEFGSSELTFYVKQIGVGQQKWIQFKYN